MTGIITYGAYIPRYRIRLEEIARVWGANAQDIMGGLGVREKSLPDVDEDTATIAVEAARFALARRISTPTRSGQSTSGPSRTRTRSSRPRARSARRSARPRP